MIGVAVATLRVVEAVDQLSLMTNLRLLRCMQLT